MAVKLRFRRMGRKQLPIFALVAADARSPRDGRYIEDLGRYEPLIEDGAIRFNEDRILYWLREGAQPSHTVRNLLSEQGVMLRLHLHRKGKTEEEIEQAVTEFLAARAAKVPVKRTKAELRAERLEKERAVAAEKAAEMAKKRAEREAELEKQRQAAEDAERAERAEASADVAGLEAAPEGATETEEAPAEEAAAEAVAEEVVEEAAPESEVVEDAAGEAPVVAEEAQEAIAEAEPVDSEPISEPEAEAAEMVEEGAPVEAAEVEEPAAEEEAAPEAEVAEEPVAEEAPVEEPVAEEAPAEEPVAVEASAEPDKLTKVLGIGPKFSALLNEHKITTFTQLAGLELEALRTIVNESGISASSANEETWSKQAGFLAAGDKDGLKAYIEEIKSAK